MPQLDKLIFFDQTVLLTVFFCTGYVYMRCFILPGLSLSFKVRDRFKKYFISSLLNFYSIELKTNSWLLNLYFFNFVYISDYLHKIFGIYSSFVNSRVKLSFKYLWILLLYHINLFKVNDYKAIKKSPLGSSLEPLFVVNTDELLDSVADTNINGRPKTIFDNYSYSLLKTQTFSIPSVYSNFELNIERYFRDFKFIYGELTGKSIINNSNYNDYIATTSEPVSDSITHLLLESPPKIYMGQPFILRWPVSSSEFGRFICAAFCFNRSSYYESTIFGLRCVDSINKSGVDKNDTINQSTNKYFAKRYNNSEGSNSSEFHLCSSDLQLSVGSRERDKRPSNGAELAIQFSMVSLPCHFSELGFLNTLSGYVAFGYLFNNFTYEQRPDYSSNNNFGDSSSVLPSRHSFNVSWQTAMVFDKFIMAPERYNGFILGRRCPFIFDQAQHDSSVSNKALSLGGDRPGYTGEDLQFTDKSFDYQSSNSEYDESNRFAASRILCLSYFISSAINTWIDAILSGFISSNTNLRRSFIWSTNGFSMASQLHEIDWPISGDSSRQFCFTSSQQSSSTILSHTGQSFAVPTILLDYQSILTQLVTKDFVFSNISSLVLINGQSLNNHLTCSELFWVTYELLVGEF